ncbi:hypothetical protein [Lacrimispora sp.]|uniref:hypothetical protein n=1 Tax=Lacrimispora sp. TaxID=2719234 RepID=UPI0032E379E0
MTKFEVIRSITDVSKFTEVVFDIVNTTESAEQLKEVLSEQLTKEGLQTIMSVAQSGNYPLSLDGMQ